MKKEYGFFDIETTGLDYNKDSVISCCFIDNNGQIMYFSNKENETILIRAIFNHLLRYKVLFAWNSDFDVNFLLGRLKELNPERYDFIGVKQYEIKNQWNQAVEKNEVKNIVFLDMLDLYKKYFNDGLISYKLDDIAELELEENKISLDVLPYELSDSDLKKYNIRDVELLFKLNEKLEIHKLCLDIMDISSCEYSDLLYNSRIMKKYFASKGIREKIKPEPDFNTYDENKGGFVETKAGMFNNVTVVDLFSLYPSIIVNEGLDDNLSDMVKELWDLRMTYKDDKTKYYAIKVLTNSLYGYLEYKYSKYYNPNIAANITKIGRELIQDAKKFVEDEKLGNVVLIDTDSMFIHNMVDGTVDKLNELFNPYIFENEGTFDVLLTGKKKNYIKYDKETGEFEYKGIKPIRRDTPPAIRLSYIEIVNKLFGIKHKDIKPMSLIKHIIDTIPKNELYMVYKAGKVFFKGGNDYRCNALYDFEYRENKEVINKYYYIYEVTGELYNYDNNGFIAFENTDDILKYKNTKIRSKNLFKKTIKIISDLYKNLDLDMDGLVQNKLV